MAGRKISRANMARIQQIADHAYAMGAKAPAPDTTPIGKAESLGDQIQAVYAAVAMAGNGAEYLYVEDVFDAFVIVEVGERYFQADYTRADDGSVTLAPRDQWVEVEEVWQPVQTSAKAGALVFDDDDTQIAATVKALGDRQLELRVAWGWDNHHEQFTPATDFDVENFPTPPVAYYHGYTKDGKPAQRPVYIGKTIKRENRADGHYLIAKLNSKPEADQVWAAALKGDAVVSPATAGHLRRKARDGTLTYWPIVEISAWDYAPNRKQAHPQSRAFPVLKALYQEAGIDLPAVLGVLPSETPGDGVSTDGPDISLDQAAPAIAKEVVSTLLQLRKRTI